ncbi:MAG TPA: amidohydrolase family protein, partial [Gemmatimonadales bacterium]|nr:amidohydrolase family protein [Gemmatimonadales bacterium]
MLRRDFVAATGAASLAIARAPALLGLGPRPDLVIRGGTVIDGTGAPGFEADLAVAGGRITALGRRLSSIGAVEIDARGLAVAPGFIDIHSHGDSNLPEDPRGESLIRQGLTTIVVGADGDSDATGAPDDTFAAYWNKVAGWHSAVNVASMVGLGAIRGRLIGDKDRPATPGEVATMRGWVAAALAGGACGASTGLEYTPGAFATREELSAVSSPLARHRLPYATHMRNEDDRLLEAIDESIAIARGAGCPLEISHLKAQYLRNWDKQPQAFARIAAARAAGVDVTFDRYPYTAYQTGLTNLFPVWSRDG